MGSSSVAIARLLLFGSIVIPHVHASDANADLERGFAQTVKPFLTSYCIGCHSGATPAAQFDLAAVFHRGSGGARLSSLEHGDGKADGQRDAAEAAQAAARRNPPGGNRLGPGRARQRGAKECRRSRAGAGAAPEQRRVQLHDPRPDGRGHSPDARISGRPGQHGRLRQFRRVADHVAGAAEQVSAGGARSRRSHGPHARRL